jgi:hypothetical protein
MFREIIAVFFSKKDVNTGIMLRLSLLEVNASHRLLGFGHVLTFSVLFHYHYVAKAFPLHPRADPETVEKE